MGLLFEPRNEPAGPLQCQIEIIDAKEQEEPVSWCRPVRTHQRGVLVDAPLVETEQDRSVRIEELAKLLVAGAVSGWPKSDWYHLKLARTSFTPMIVQVRFMVIFRQPNETKLSHRYRWTTIRRECVSAKTRITPLCGKLKSGLIIDALAGA
jgi:hypothetical protein